MARVPVPSYLHPSIMIKRARSHRSTWTRWLGLLLACLSPWAAAGAEPDPAVLESLGMYVASLQSSLERWPDVRGQAQPTEHQAAVLELLVRDVSMVRLHLQTRARALPADSREAQALQRFLDDWPASRLEEGLRAAPRASPLDAAVRQLARVLPEKRSFSPPFRLFRP